METTIKDFIQCVSFETATEVLNYPYGFSQRTKIKYWIETKGNKQRFCSATLNPKTQQWNKPKYSTYSDLILMYKEKETGYIKSYHYNIAYSDEEDFKKLLEFLGDFRNAYIDTFLKMCRAIYETRKYIKVEIRAKQFKHKVTGEIVEQVPIFKMNEYEEITEEEHDAQQEQVKKDIGKIFIHNAKKEGLTTEEIKQQF